MNMFVKFKSAVLGNQILRDFDIGKQIGSGGPGCYWKLYASKKKSNGQLATVFLHEKKLTERLSKKDREKLFELLKNEATYLARLRHPCVLELLATVEETPSDIAFATEPLFTCLANVLGQHDNLSPLPLCLKEYQIESVEIQNGLQQLGEALAFCHNDAKLIHGNITPTSIYISNRGDWKLSGLSFSKYSQYMGEQTEDVCFHEFDPKQTVVTQPLLNFLAPEYVLEKTCSPASDMFSLAQLVYTVYNHGKPLMNCNNNVLTYKSNLESLTMRGFGAVPDELHDLLSSMFSLTSSLRPQSRDFSVHPFFESLLILTLRYLESLVEKDGVKKAQFLKGLDRLIPLFPRRVLHMKILPSLLAELRSAIQIPFVLPNIFAISEDMSQSEFVELVFSDLIPVFSIVEPMQVMLIMLQRMDFILSKTPVALVNAHALPMLYRALDSSSPQMQELCIKLIPTFASTIEYSQLKNSIFPRILTVCMETDVLSVRVNALVAINKMLDLLDKWTVVERLIPALETIPSREPAVLMSVLGVYDTIVAHKKLCLEKKLIATQILPHLLPLAMEDCLNGTQFRTWMSVIRSMLLLVEKERLQALDTDAAIKEQASALNTSDSNRTKESNEVAISRNLSVKDDAFDKMESLIRNSLSISANGSDNSGKANSLLDIFGETAPSNSPTMQAKSSNSSNNSSNAVASKTSNHGDNEIGQMLEQMGNSWNYNAGDTKTFPVKVAPSLNQGSVALKSNPLAHHSINAENTVASSRSLWMDKPNEYLHSSSVIEPVLLSPKLDSSSHQSQPWTSTLHRTDHSSSNSFMSASSIAKPPLFQQQNSSTKTSSPSQMPMQSGVLDNRHTLSSAPLMPLTQPSSRTIQQVSQQCTSTIASNSGSLLDDMSPQFKSWGNYNIGNSCNAAGSDMTQASFNVRNGLKMPNQGGPMILTSNNQLQYSQNKPNYNVDLNGLL